jgi:hypothetical protein
MATLAQTTDPVGRPGNDMSDAGSYLLLAARAPVGLAGAAARDPSHEPVAVAVGLPSFDPTDGSVQIKGGVLTASTMGAGHGTDYRRGTQAGGAGH